MPAPTPSAPTGNHAYGFAAATDVNGANSDPSVSRYASGATPSAARRATSQIGNVSHAWNTSWATSAGWNGASNGNGLRSGSRNENAGRSPAFFNRRTVSNASAPVTIARSQSPASMSAATSFTRTCGVVPPMPE